MKWTRGWRDRATVQFQSSAKPDAADVGLDFIAVWGAKGVSVCTACSIVLKRGGGIAKELGMGVKKCRGDVRWPIGRFVGAVGGFCGCEGDAVVALDLGGRGQWGGGDGGGSMVPW